MNILYEKTSEPQKTEIVNVFLFSLIALLLGAQLITAIAFIFSFFPLERAVQQITLIERSSELRPEREVAFYRTAVFLILAFQGGLFFKFRKRLSDQTLSKELRSALWAEGTWVLLASIVLFKMHILHYPFLLKVLLCAILTVSLLTKIFRVGFERNIERFCAWQIPERRFRLFRKLCDVAVPLLLFLVLFIPDVKGAVQKIFLEDKFVHFDVFVMSPAWAFLKGGLPNFDVVSEYGFGLPVMIGTLAKWFGGLTYESVLMIFVAMSLFYFFLAYVLLRIWLGSVSLSAIVLLWLLNLQMFQVGTYPIAWKIPQMQVVRSFFDMPFLLFLFLHTKTKRKYYLFAMSLCTGFALFYITDSGIYLLTTFCSYLFLMVIQPDYRRELKVHPLEIIGHLIFPLGMACFLFYSFLGDKVLTSIFWMNQTEFLKTFLGGLSALPIYEILERKNYFTFFLGFLTGALYLFTLTFVGTLWFLRRIDRKHVFVMIVAIYGLCTYHYYMCRTDPAYLFAIVVPFGLVCGFWLKHILVKSSIRLRRCFLAGLSVLSVVFLMTVPNFVEYPNVLHRRISFGAKEKEILESKYDFSKDALLIRNLTPEGQKVPVISSFETAILMKADRRPFFYYFPLLFSRYDPSEFGGTYLMTQERLDKTLNHFEREKPEYVFVGKKLTIHSGDVHLAYFLSYRSITRLMVYLEKHYVRVAAGPQIVAMKRIADE